MIARAFPYDRLSRFQKFEATETIVTTGTTIWKPGFKHYCFCEPSKSFILSEVIKNVGINFLPAVLIGDQKTILHC